MTHNPHPMSSQKMVRKSKVQTELEAIWQRLQTVLKDNKALRDIEDELRAEITLLRSQLADARSKIPPVVKVPARNAPKKAAKVVPTVKKAARKREAK